MFPDDSGPPLKVGDKVWGGGDIMEIHTSTAENFHLCAASSLLLSPL